MWKWLKAAFEKLPKAMSSAADIMVLTGIAHRTPQGKVEVEESVLRSQAPRMTKKAEHESRWTQLLAQLDPQTRNIILLQFMRRLHEEQQADLVQSASNASKGTSPDEGQENTRRVLNHLRHLAALQGTTASRTHRLRVDYLDGLNWIKGNPNEYRIVRIQRLARRRFRDLQDLYRWLNDPNGPVIQWLEQHTATAQAHTAQLQALRQNIAQPPRPPYSWDPAVRHAQRNRGRLSRWFHERFGI